MSDSRIVRLRAYAVVPESTAPVRYTAQDAPERMAHELFRVTLADGSEGVAGTLSGWMGAPPGRLLGPLAALAGRAVGVDVADREALTARLLVERESGGLPEAESLLDVAMWDAWGCHLGVPLWRMLGGFRERIPAYASTAAFLSIEDYLDETRRAQALGYKAVKFHMNCDPSFDLAMVETVAAAHADSGLRFMVDLEQRYGFDDAVRLGRRLSGLPFDWMEAPLPDDDLDAYAELRRAVGIDVLPAGNTLVGPEAWAEGLRRGAWSRLRADACNGGGITSLVRGMALARARGLTTEVQAFGYPASQAANLHVMLGVPGCSWFEHPVPAADFEYGVMNPIGLDPEGRVAAPDGPGLGLVMDWNRIESDAIARFDSEG